jgi:hypothetical protein
MTSRSGGFDAHVAAMTGASASRIRHPNGRAQITMFGVILAGKPNDQDWRH